MSQTFMTLKTSLDQKDEEISRYKNGYDATIFKNFLLRFTRVDKVIKEYIGDNKIDLNGLQDIQIQMDDALAECDVEIYIPEIGLEEYKTSAYIKEKLKRWNIEFKDGYSTDSFGAKSHDYSEEIFIVSGRVYDKAFEQWLETGTYASRPPDEVHGPFIADGDVLIMEMSYPSQSIKNN